MTGPGTEALGDGEERRDRLGADLLGEDLAHGKVGRLAPAEAKKKIPHQAMVWVVAVSTRP